MNKYFEIIPSRNSSRRKGDYLDAFLFSKLKDDSFLNS